MPPGIMERPLQGDPRSQFSALTRLGHTSTGSGYSCCKVAINLACTHVQMLLKGLHLVT